MHENIVGKEYQRPWGSYKTLEQGNGYQVKMITIEPGGCLSLQKHFKRKEHWLIIQGSPTITIGEKTKTCAVDETAYIPIATPHRLENLTNQTAAVIEVQLGAYLGEDDIDRIEDVYGREGTNK